MQTLYNVTDVVSVAQRANLRILIPYALKHSYRMNDVRKMNKDYE